MDNKKTTQIMIVVSLMSLAITLLTVTWIFGFDIILNLRILIPLIMSVGFIVLPILLYLIYSRKKKTDTPFIKNNQIQQDSTLPDAYNIKDFEENKISLIRIFSILIACVILNASMIAFAYQNHIGPFEREIDRNALSVSEVVNNPENYLNKNITVAGYFFENANNRLIYCSGGGLDLIRLILPDNFDKSKLEEGSRYYWTGIFYKSEGHVDYISSFYLVVSSVQKI